ncbi:MAG: hypothetical protein A2W90_04790 [Bacteroidetes bacterium GWF2_42_66]|nr:MAG: hypothetical protein A2W89_21010 [Bacteroidetes bacterium GWE2_42_39]OFY40806.1 MAG: hypothetical protein A2W90_04790 [Bacteroidetes bacterium GWF2_42_66]HAZ00570.1 hypothetical protein [Marinilabiliales bacterium]HBL75822.1 hypothetical protein [Prolixibacteraceae bacterium]HCU63071.1 hypothetical protein [Prolixibacteraceae bacterium]
MDSNFTTYNSLKEYIEKSNFIYVIYSEYGCKIGYTKTPLERIEQIKLGLPSQKCFFIGLYANERALTFEKKLHEKFKAKQISREWFILDDNDLEYIYDYLIKKDFKCLIKNSIIWANYLLPSIYVTGNVKIIGEVKRQTKKTDIQIPRLFIELIEIPTEKEIENNGVEYFTATDISKMLKNKGLKCTPETTGQILKKMGAYPKGKRIPGIGSRKVYYVKIRNNIPLIE